MDPILLCTDLDRTLIPNGLPPGRYSFWVEWHASCSYWIPTTTCVVPSEPVTVTLFASSVNAPFYDEATFTGTDDLGGVYGLDSQYDPWDNAASPHDPFDDAQSGIFKEAQRWLTRTLRDPA